MPITAVGADGAQATQNPVVDLSYEVLPRSAPGFDSEGLPTVRSRPVVATKRVRLVEPNAGQLTADQVWLSDHVYQGDVLNGGAVANNSTMQSPKPVMVWAHPGGEVVGDFLTVEVCAAHRDGWDGEPIARAEARATAGGITVYAASSTLIVLPSTTDRQAVLGYRMTLDLRTLPDNSLVTVNAKGWPLIGNAGSIVDSADQADPRLFSPRTYFRNVAKAAAPNIIRVAPGGVDATAYVGTDPVAADAAPALTIGGAYARLVAVLGANGALDGARIQCAEGTYVLTANTSDQVLNCFLWIEPKPGANPANVIYEFGAANFTFRTSRLRFRNMRLRRMGIYPLNNSANAHTVVDGGVFDSNGQTSAVFSGTAHGHSFVGGVEIINHSGNSPFASSANVVQRIWRGVKVPASGSWQVELNCLLGCELHSVGTSSAVARDRSGAFIGFNKFLKQAAGIGFLSTSTPTIVGMAVVQNLFEFVSSVSAASLVPSADGDSASTRHFILWHNTCAGFYNHGRINEFYNETSAVLRSHDLLSEVGNLYVSTNTKHDKFAQVNGLPNVSQRTGGWPATNGVGVRGTFARYDSAALEFRHEFPGLNANKGLTTAGAGLDPLFTNYQATTQAAGAGAGLGTYTLEAGSPAESMVPNTPLRIDIAGNQRNNTGAAGAYRSALAPATATGGGAFAPMTATGIAASTVVGQGGGSFAAMTVSSVLYLRGIEGVYAGTFAPMTLAAEGADGAGSFFLAPEPARIAAAPGALYVNGRVANA